MRLIFTTLVAATLIFGCNSTDSDESNLADTSVEDYDEVKQQLMELRKSEIELLEYYHSSSGKVSEGQLNKKRDSLYVANCEVIKSLFSRYGYLGIDKVGEERARNFSEIVIHCFSDNEFQKQVLEKMEIELDRKNVKPNDYAILIDKQKVHSGEKQIYGTQVSTNPSSMWVAPEPIVDSMNVNKRRAEIGLDPLEQYLNRVMQAQFDLNEVRYKEMGIMEPLKYE